jgi:hypothetical protein
VDTVYRAHAVEGISDEMGACMVGELGASAWANDTAVCPPYPGAGKQESLNFAAPQNQAVITSCTRINQGWTRCIVPTRWREISGEMDRCMVGELGASAWANDTAVCPPYPGLLGIGQSIYKPDVCDGEECMSPPRGVGCLFSWVKGLAQGFTDEYQQHQGSHQDQKGGQGEPPGIDIRFALGQQFTQARC